MFSEIFIKLQCIYRVAYWLMISVYRLMTRVEFSQFPFRFLLYPQSPYKKQKWRAAARTSTLQIYSCLKFL